MRKEKPSKPVVSTSTAAVMRQACHDQQLQRYHDCNVKKTSFNIGDLVLRGVQKTNGMHKLSAPL
jgi:hypothetical protein